MIRKLKSGKYMLVSKKHHKNLGVFDSMGKAEKHEREVEYFKHKNLNEADDTANLVSQRHQLMVQMQSIQQQLAALDQRLLDSRKAALAKTNQQVQQPLQPGSGTIQVPMTESGEHHEKPQGVLHIIDIEDEKSSIHVWYKLSHKTEDEELDIDKSDFMQWYGSYAKDQYGTEYIDSFKDSDEAGADEDGYPVSFKYIDFVIMWSNENLDEKKNIVRKYLLYKMKHTPELTEE